MTYWSDMRTIDQVSARAGIWSLGRKNGTRVDPCASSQGRYFGARADTWKPRSWLKDLPVCPALGQHHILHVGVAKAAGAIDFNSIDQNSSYFLGCLTGQGRLGIDGRWYVCDAGAAYLVPARSLDFVPGTNGKAWEFCWVCRVQPAEGIELGAPMQMARFDPLPLRYAIEGLACECKGEAVPRNIQQWADLIQSYVMRLVHRGGEEEPLTALWERVSAEVDADWNLARLAREAGYSCGHLGRLCRRQIGRSPMHQVTWLRMRRAAEMLVTTNLTIEAVAQQVGYANAFVFSNAFTRWVGWRPSDYRRRDGGKWRQQ